MTKYSIIECYLHVNIQDIHTNVFSVLYSIFYVQNNPLYSIICNIVVNSFIVKFKTKNII